jgi:2-iminobutanoate/2-iminopropanoate deaminase
VRAGDWVVLAGQVGFDAASGRLAEGGVAAEARQAFANIRAVLGDCGATLGDVARATVFVTNIADLPIVNEVWAEAFGDHKPARTTIQAAALPVGAAIEIEVWAHLGT